MRDVTSGAEVGPVNLDQVRRGFENGNIPATSVIARVGSDEWSPVDSFLRIAARAVPPPARATAPSIALGEHPGPARAKPARSLRLPLLGAIVAVAVLGAGAVAYRFLERRPARALPVLAKRLPPRTTRVVETRLRADLDELPDLPPAYAASALALSACGGVDVARLLAEARGKDIAFLKRRGVLDMATSASLRDALSCGESVRKSLTSPTMTLVAFADGDRSHLVTLLASTMTDAPADAGFVRHNFSGLPGFCKRPLGGKEDCPDGAVSAFHDGTTWVFGDVSAVESFARAYTTAHEGLTTTVEILAETTKQTRGADITEVVARPEGVPWREVCERAAPIEHREDFVKRCFPAGQDTILKSVDTKLRGLAVERDVLARASTFGVSYLLVARDDAAARDIEKDLLDLSRDWRAHLSNNEPDLIKLARAPSTYIHDRFWEAALDPFLRALRNATVKRSGAVVRFDLREQLRPTEVKLLKEFVETRSEDQVATLKILEAIAQRSPLPEKSLAVFVGPDVAAWIVAPRATDAACAAIAAKIASFTGADLPPDQFGLKLEVEQRYAKSACVGAVLPPEAEACLLGSTTLQALSECKLPRSPFALALRRRLEGQWQVATTKFSRSVTRPQRLAIESSKLEFADGKIAFSFDGTTAEGDPAIATDELDRGVFSLPLGKEQVRKHVVFGEGDTIRIPDFGEGIEVTFKRVKLEKGLVAPSRGAFAPASSAKPAGSAR
ncbi:MAG: hypothetical protein IT374_18565 [Polyangiaceae bacterium]|nr:hypothetical protein [Polyangiaceae bacterium]